MSKSKSTIVIFFVFFFVSLCSTHVSSVSVQSFTYSSDIAALKAFKVAIKPSSISQFSCLSSWNFTTDPCSVPHVTHFICGLSCTGNRVTQITLDPVSYSGLLSPLVSKLTQLVTLDLSNNIFYGPIPDSLSSLPNLQILNLQFNSFSGSVPPSLTSLNSLLSLDLAHNSLSGSLPNSMNSLSGLRRLDLSFNKLTGSLPKLPPNLIELAIKANSLSGSLQKYSFSGLTQLEVVELSENSFSGTIEPWFFQIPSLQQIDLANNSFSSIKISKPNNLESDLVAVDLGFNKIEGNIPMNFVSYQRLSSLTLRYNKLRGPIPWQYSTKETLKRLYLDGNYLNGSPPAGFFTGKTPVTGSLGDNCLEKCPSSSELCSRSQKPTPICEQVYGGGGKPKSL